MRKAGIHDLTIQSSQLQIFEGKSVKGTGNEKVGIYVYDLTIQSSFFAAV